MLVVMKTMGVLGGISPQATMDFEARVHRVSQRLIPQDRNHGYPPMVVWFHRRLPMKVGADGRPLVPREIDPQIVAAAAWLGQRVDFLAIPCNSAHVGLAQIAAAAGRPVLSMIDLVVADVARRGWRSAGVLGFGGAPALYLDPLRGRGIRCEAIDAALQASLDTAILTLMEGREGAAEIKTARAAVDTVRARGVDGVVLGCTEIPLLLGDEAEASDLVNPVALLAEAAVRFAIEA
jgi:aspartate racemase